MVLAGRAVAGPTGSLKGFVFDQSGIPLRGVKVTVSRAGGQTGAGGPWSKHTDPEGTVVFASLPVGKVDVTATAPRVESFTQKDVVIAAGGTTEVNLILELSTATEEIAIVQKAPLVSTTSANVRESFDLDLSEGLPPVIAERPARAAPGPPFNTESYAHLPENPFLAADRHPLSTFGLDVDTASYANVRRFLEAGTPPPAGAVRIEELINYFTYAHAPPRDGAPFAVSFDLAACPWNPEARLVSIGLRGKDVPTGQRPPSNLVFLIDVSGSMDEPRKLPLVKESLRLLVHELRPDDRIALVVYAGQSGLVLPSTAASARKPILEAIDRLEAGGSTNGGAGIELAYATARQAFIRGGNNRVLLATDGDFNVGTTSESALVSLIQAQAHSGVFLTVLGFGAGNLKDSTMEQLADKGNGQYAYIDSVREARKALVEQLSGTLLTIAKDVKLQVEMNPARVGAYRLLGYENRLMPAEDFNDDRKDGGELGAGHTVTALYEILAPGPSAARALSTGGTVDPLRYAAPAPASTASSGDLLTVKVRYKAPDGDDSRKLEWRLVDARDDRGATGVAGQTTAGREMSVDLRFATAVAAFGMILRGSVHRGTADLALVERLGREGLGTDAGGYRRQFLELVARARQLDSAGWSLGGDAPAEGELVISRTGRPDLRLAVAGRRIDGRVAGLPFHVLVKTTELQGHLGGEPLWMAIRGREAEGHIGGHEVGFVLTETPRGFLLRGQAVGHTVRMEESHGELSWLPSCERPLLRLPRERPGETVYQGSCASGQRVRLVMPRSFELLPPLPRLVLLGLLLTEKPEILSIGRRALFPVESR
jgi:Ca-activated chloride channel family protein